MLISNNKSRGVTLIEILLVLVISSIVVAMLIGFIQQRTEETRRTRTSLQMQEILRAGASFYSVMNRWPKDIDELRTLGFLPQKFLYFKNPWGQDYLVSSKPYGNTFYVYTDTKALANALVVEGKLPLGFVSDSYNSGLIPPTAGSCSDNPEAYCTYVVASTSVASQLNNAENINFASVYHSGACVPEPKCPVDKEGKQMTPEITVLPAAVSGNFDEGGAATDVFPISGYTASALGPFDLSRGDPRGCETTEAIPCQKDLRDPFKSGRYWRVCLSVYTERGAVGVIQTKDRALNNGAVIAITRCKPQNENTGSDFTVWSP